MTHSKDWPELRPFQREAIHSIQRHRHTLLIAPTGAGKSLVFQRYLFENLKKSRAVLVTPLVALGRQQIRRLQDLQIPAWCGVGDAKQVQFPDQRAGVWVVSPERLLFQEDRLFEEWQPNFFIFDEAHCVFDWGEEFRPAFNLVKGLFERRQIEKSFWCSATLRQEMVANILQICGPGTQVLGQFKVPENISLERLELIGDKKLSWIELWLRGSRNHSGILYAGTRALAERLAFYLSTPQRPFWVYHAGMSSEERIALEGKIEKAHRDCQPFLIVATSAFGMGMDYPQLRFAILFDPPYTVLQLAQSLGRVGRSGAPAQVFCLWNRGDFLRLKNHCRGRTRALDELQRLLRWYESSDSPQEALQKDFHEIGGSGKVGREGSHDSDHPIDHPHRSQTAHR